jgi:hypothetical protein
LRAKGRGRRPCCGRGSKCGSDTEAWFAYGMGKGAQQRQLAVIFAFLPAYQQGRRSWRPERDRERGEATTN